MVENRRKRLARFVTPESGALVETTQCTDLLQQPDGCRQLVQAIYEALAAKQIQYAPEKYHPSEAIQLIRTPLEILEAPREGTCLDLAVLFCGLCLGYDLLPWLVVIEGHALTAVSLTHGLREWNVLNRREHAWFEKDLLTDSDTITRISGFRLLSFARMHRLRPQSESTGFNAGGYWANRRRFADF